MKMEHDHWSTNKSFHDMRHEIHWLQENTKKKDENLENVKEEKRKEDKAKEEKEEPIEEADRAGPECPNHIFPRATCQHRNIPNLTQKYS